MASGTRRGRATSELGAELASDELASGRPGRTGTSNASGQRHDEVNVTSVKSADDDDEEERAVSAAPAPAISVTGGTTGAGKLVGRLLDWCQLLAAVWLYLLALMYHSTASTLIGLAPTAVKGGDNSDRSGRELEMDSEMARRSAAGGKGEEEDNFEGNLAAESKAADWAAPGQVRQGGGGGEWRRPVGEHLSELLIQQALLEMSARMGSQARLECNSDQSLDDEEDQQQPLEASATHGVVTSMMEEDNSASSHVANDGEIASSTKRQEEAEVRQEEAEVNELEPLEATGECEESSYAPVEQQDLPHQANRLDADQVAHEIDAMFEEALQAAGGPLEAEDRLVSPTGDCSQSSNCSDLAARSSSLAFSTPEVEEPQGESNQEEDEEEGHLSEHSDDFCGEQASESTLRRLKMDAYEDALVCAQNRHSMLMARRLFSGQLMDDPMEKLSPEDFREDEDDWRRSFGKLSSQNSSGTESDEGHPQSPEQQAYDIKLPSRSASSASSLHNVRRTLVCSVSPTGELAELGSELGGREQAYPMNGSEIQHCRAAFRANRRLIEEQSKATVEAALNLAILEENSRQSSAAASQWSERLRQRTEPQVCSKCKQRLYPVDKMELDFTRQTLEIHRNCFKCHICSTLLRLETYAAMDAKLYCPAHVKVASKGPTGATC